MAWKIGPLNEYEAESAIIPFVGITIRKEHELRQQCQFIFISLGVVTNAERYLRPATKCAACSL
jgi:hypothetical protein